jgi:rRNA maturation protein Nop10
MKNLIEECVQAESPIALQDYTLKLNCGNCGCDITEELPERLCVECYEDLSKE